PQLEEVPLNERVISCKRFMENVCQSRDINLQMDLCNENPTVNIDTSLFEQVLINIIKNSAESIGEKGCITIRTSSDPLMLEIGDTGKGISKETETMLFTPFFSTKPNGQGIGLIFIREVLMKHNCNFSLRTYPDGITRFCICF
ncbi:MAG: PAS domain-containing sensor histidine kinase, partial [Bacteroidaceae bacterium]|nr:PAS domain-containing sensor histidine kinase [Bacteroidaceae bacterium]